ncbi:MAG: hypothetical protein OXF84_10315, partial [Bacteroidetes bacterium]|nr:hypothetical protein [Bacteroidota bacterium]
PATGDDYRLSTNTTLTIPVGQTSSTGLVTITAIDNDTDGPERKEITVSGISSSNAEGPDDVTLIIEDDDEEPIPLMLSIERVGTAYEGVSTGQLRVELNRPADRVVTVQYATWDSSATAPSDFVASQGLVIFDPNATRGVVQVMIVDDEITENAENLIVEISNPIGAIVKDGEGVGILTIEDNDTASAVVRIEDEVGLESDGMIRFRVHMSVPSSEPVSVSYHTRDGTAKAGEDYHADAGVIEFVPGVVESTIDIVLLRDSLDWADETFSVHLGKSTHGRIEKDVAVATIQKKTTAVQDILVPYVARFLRTSSMHLVMSVQDRVESESGASVCGAVNRTNLVRLWQTASDWQPSMGELLAGCHVSTAQADGRFGVWGRGAYRRFRGQESDALQLRGSVATGLLGVDYRWNGSWMAGLMLAHSRGDGSYEILQDTGELEAGLTGLYPYVSYQHRMGGVWGTGGFGRGRVEGQDASGRLTSTFGAIGGWGKLLSVYQLRLSYHGDLWVAHADVADPDLSAQVFQTRLGMQASLNLGTYIHPFMQANVRQDGGDAETGLGFELGGGVRVSVPALKLKADVRSQGLILHAADGYSEWGISGSMQVGESEGLMVRVRPSWGASQSTSLHHHQTVLDVVPQGDYRTEMEVGYGIAMGATTARTVTGATLHPNGTMLRLGGEFRPKDGMTVTMLVHAPAQRHPNIGLNLRGLLRF